MNSARSKTYVERFEIFLFIKLTFYAILSLCGIYKKNVNFIEQLNMKRAP